MSALDYRAFLPSDAADPVVLPYFGGSRVEAPARRLRVDRGGHTELAPGWWSFRVDGRRAVVLAAASPADLADRPAVRGHWAEGWLFGGGRDRDRIALAPVEEPEPLARCTGRRWYAGELLLDSIDFDDEAEAEARRALEEQRSLVGVRGVAPSLRAAFGFALVAAVGRSLGVAVSPREVSGRVHAIADGGRGAALALVAELAQARREQTVMTVAAGARPVRHAGDLATRADTVLEAAGARMLTCRRLTADTLEVRFECEGERFVAVIDAATFQVLDAGICLAGADREVTLDSLPSVIREAIEVDHLNITRR
jgi:hypothetical protein